MRKTLFGTIFSILLFFGPFQNALGQSENKTLNNKINDNSEYFSVKFLKSDYEQADIVVYVDVKEVISAGASDNQTDCVNFTGIGYCSFLLKAQVKEIYKGGIKTKTIDFYTYGEAELIGRKERYLGESVVFLEKFNDSGKIRLQVIENSIRWIEYDVLKKMRQIAKKN